MLNPTSNKVTPSHSKAPNSLTNHSTLYNNNMLSPPLLLLRLLLATTTAVVLAAPTNPNPNNNQLQMKLPFTSPSVHLTVSSLASTLLNGTTTDRRLVLNWANVTDNSQLIVSLYPGDPSSSTNTPPPLFSAPITTPTGSLTTPIKYPHLLQDDEDSPPFTPTTPSPICTPFHIAVTTSSNNSSLLLSSCLAIYPTWMWTLRATIGPRPLSSLFIPGTHDAGAYQHYQGTPSDNPITKYVFTQEDSIYSQLVHGVRYLDIRAACYNGEFFLNHGDFRVRPMADVIAEVNAFLRHAPHEVVIFDVHNFPVGFNDNDTVHHDFVSFLTNSFTVSAAPKTSTITYNDIIDNGHNLLIGYAEERIRNQYTFLHNNVHHAWADTTSVDALLKFQESSLVSLGCRSSSDPILWSGMVQLTPTAADIISRPLYGLRGFANEVNPLITPWYTQAPAFYARANIVASDFFLQNNLVHTAFTINSLNQSYCQQ